MKHKYNIQRLLMSIVGYQGLPYPGMFFPPRPVGSYTGDEVEIPTSPAPRQELIKGTRLYKQDALGRWYFMPVFIKHKDIRSNDKARSSDNEHTLELENAVISIEGTKNIVRTPLIGRRGSVKELISIGDYKISIAAFIKQLSRGADHTDERTLQHQRIGRIDFGAYRFVARGRRPDRDHRHPVPADAWHRGRTGGNDRVRNRYVF